MSISLNNAPDWGQRLTALGSIAAVLVAAAAVLFSYQANKTANQAELAQLKLMEQGQITDRFTKAVDQLGADNTEIRLGGVYALQRIMRDSEADQQAVINVLSAYVRRQAQRRVPAKPLVDGRPRQETSSGLQWPAPSPEIQSILDVLARRPVRPGAETAVIDLSDTSLVGANLEKANLQGVILRNTDLTGARLIGANLTRADLYGAVFVDADLSNATFVNGTFDRAAYPVFGADFTGAVMEHIDLTGIALPGSVLAGADLSYAKLAGADLTFDDLRCANLQGADLTGTILTRSVTSSVVLDQDQMASAAFIDDDGAPQFVASGEPRIEYTNGTVQFRCD